MVRINKQADVALPEQEVKASRGFIEADGSPAPSVRRSCLELWGRRRMRFHSSR